MAEVIGNTIHKFQSLFSWNLLLMSDQVKSLLSMKGFQSLFSWNLLLMDEVALQPESFVNVSILVFVELALDGLQNAMEDLVSSGVSILVFVELALDDLIIFSYLLL